MITVERKEKIEKEYAFKDLCVGDCFLDRDEDVCIKVDDDNCLVSLGPLGWKVLSAEPHDLIVPVEATLIINDEK